MASLNSNFSLIGVAVATTTVLLVFLLGRVIYNVHFHPLRRFSGPLFWRATRLGYVMGMLKGTIVFDVLDMFNRYGPIVRIAPNELAFLDPEAWRDIYGHRIADHYGFDEMDKYQTFYRTRGVPPSIMTDNRENHALLRRQLSYGFSEKSMREQEPIIGGYVDLLMRQLRARCATKEESAEAGEYTKKPSLQPLDMRAWYNWTTFDVIGDLAFGEPFGCLEKAEYHPWVKTIIKFLMSSVIVSSLKLLGFHSIMSLIVRFGMRVRKEHRQRLREKMERRVAKGDRPDLIQGLLRKKDDWNMDMGRLLTNASLLIIAGSETTATSLSGVTYLLLKNPECMRKLTEEVRSTFRTEDEITMTSVGILPYMLACLNEGLRRYPPASFGLPRVTPKGGARIAGVFVPEDTAVSVWQWAAYHSTRNFAQPFDFLPERWLDNPHGDKLDAVQPFSIGPRNCIGRNLAFAEMRLVLARLVFNFDMRLADPDQDWMKQKVYVIWDKPPLNVYLTPVSSRLPQMSAKEHARSQVRHL
ncbi:putative Cytochrome P450 [Pleurostoma richardsiae]|uniref:Cytochrome P450 n=1 Tax=Pleurostoma richardsiae TaxID=41990 RepID=A0AA38RNY8_9PEZI|nr:putative Cytochrome P450 [Pleurostoma richardsiae]